MYCFRGETETKTVLPAGLRLRDCERMDAVGLDERPLAAFSGDGLGVIRSSHASSSDVVESYEISVVRCSISVGRFATFLILDMLARGAMTICDVYHA